LVREALESGERAIQFRHPLLQEAVYAAILHKQRRDMHGRTAAVLEKLYAGRLTEQAAVLAYHFDQAGDPRALSYTVLAADAEARRYANAEAVAHYSRAIELWSAPMRSAM